MLEFLATIWLFTKLFPLFFLGLVVLAVGVFMVGASLLAFAKGFFR